MPDVLLLCRHMKRVDESRVTAATRGDSEPPDQLAAVADRLVGALRDDGVTVSVVLHAPSSLATAHGRWLHKRMLASGVAGAAMRCEPRLDEVEFMAWTQEKAVDEFTADLLAEFSAGSAGAQGRAVLVVGHMPQLGWIAARLLANRPLWMRVLDGYAPILPLTNSEVAAIRLTGDFRGRPSGRLEWTVAPGQREAIDELQTKIKSKMEVAKLLGGFMSLVLVAVLLAPGRLRELSEGGDGWAVAVAAVSFLLAIGLYLRTMYAYDTLLMPIRFWGDGPPGSRRPRWLVRRPPSSAAWVLYQNMMHVWTFLFTPATVAVIVGLLALAYSAFEPTWGEGLVVGAVLVVVGWYALRRGPVLGSQD